MGAVPVAAATPEEKSWWERIWAKP